MNSRVSRGPILPLTGPYVHVLRRILRRLLVVLFRDLQVVFGSHLRAVADPLADDVTGEGSFQFRLPGGSQVLKKLRPRLQAGPLTETEGMEGVVGVMFRPPVGSGFVLFELFFQILDLFEILGIRRERFGGAAVFIEGIVA